MILTDEQWTRVWCRYFADTEERDRRGPHRMGDDGLAIPHPMVLGLTIEYARRRKAELKLDMRLPERPGRDAALRLPFEQQQQRAATDAELLEWGIIMPLPPVRPPMRLVRRG